MKAKGVSIILIRTLLVLRNQMLSFVVAYSPETVMIRNQELLEISITPFLTEPNYLEVIET